MRICRPSHCIGASIIGLLLALVATASASAAAPAHVLTVTGSDYRFDLSSREVAAGLVTVRFSNKGRAPHHVVLAKLHRGVTAADYVSASKKGVTGEAQPLDRLVDYMGGAGTLLPGGSQKTYQQLTAGHYLALCLLPSHMADNKTHMELGMIASFNVVGKANRHPPAHVQGTLTGYDFGFHSPTRVHGHGVYRFKNARTATVHEALIVRMQPGKTVTDIENWFRAVVAHNQQGPPPYAFAGGSGWLSRGRSQWLKLNLAPGQYALVCEVPEDASGDPHAAMGMVAPLTVVS